MDNQKDNNNSHSRELDLQNSASSKDIISFFNADEDFVFVYKKTEKLATAVYLITNLFSDNEPVKWTLRKKVGDILAFVLNYKDIVISDHKNFSDTLKTKVLELTSLLEISSHSGLISYMNYSILKQEFAELLRRIDSSRDHKDSVQNNISTAFFDVPDEPTRHIPTHNTPQVSEQKHSHASATLSDIGASNNTENIKDKGLFKKTNRQASIINLLKKKNNLTIKDIAQVVKDCSEKTIQRELISLITSGLIKKTGERRWTKYSLIGNN